MLGPKLELFVHFFQLLKEFCRHVEIAGERIPHHEMLED